MIGSSVSICENVKAVEQTISLKPRHNGGAIGGTADLRIRCPGCLHLVTLAGSNPNSDIRLNSATLPSILAGYRFCPNSDCRQFVFVVYNAGKVLQTFPPERIDFDATNIPTRFCRPWRKRSPATRLAAT